MLDVDNTQVKNHHMLRVYLHQYWWCLAQPLKFCYCFRVVFRWWDILLRTVIRKLQNFFVNIFDVDICTFKWFNSFYDLLMNWFMRRFSKLNGKIFCLGEFNLLYETQNKENKCMKSAVRLCFVYYTCRCLKNGFFLSKEYIKHYSKKNLVHLIEIMVINNLKQVILYIVP